VCRIPVAAVLFAGVQVICVNRVSATGAMLTEERQHRRAERHAFKGQRIHWTESSVQERSLHVWAQVVDAHLRGRRGCLCVGAVYYIQIRKSEQRPCLCVGAVYYIQIREQRPPLHLRAADHRPTAPAV